MTQPRYRIGASAAIMLCLVMGWGPLAAQASGNDEADSTSSTAFADSFQYSTRSFANYVPVFVGNGFLFGAREKDSAGGIQAQPSQQRQQAGKENEDGIVAGDRSRHAFQGVLASARAQNPGHRQSRQPLQRGDSHDVQPQGRAFRGSERHARPACFGEPVR